MLIINYTYGDGGKLWLGDLSVLTLHSYGFYGFVSDIKRGIDASN